MTLRERYALQPETLQEFELAWELRYAEGRQLIVGEVGSEHRRDRHLSIGLCRRNDFEGCLPSILQT